MTDQQIIEQLLDEHNAEPIVLTDDFNDTFKMAQLGTIPLHGVVYAVLDLLEINGTPVSEEDAGLVVLELDFDSESGWYYVETVEDDALFDEVIAAYEAVE
jgi:hypothetical protein